VASDDTSASLPRSLRRDAAGNRERLVNAAARIFAEQGLEASVQQVAEAAGVGMGTLYRRFPTKDALVDALAEDLLRRVLAAAQEALGREPPDQAFQAFLTAAGRLNASHRGYLQRLWTSPAAVQSRDQFRELTGQLLAKAQAAGSVRSDITIEDVSVILWSLKGVIEEAGTVNPHIWERHLEVVIAGLRPGSAPLHHPALPPVDLERITALRRRRGAGGEPLARVDGPAGSVG
jgi:AcrR family transcriptional regulator